MSLGKLATELEKVMPIDSIEVTQEQHVSTITAEPGSDGGSRGPTVDNLGNDEEWKQVPRNKTSPTKAAVVVDFFSTSPTQFQLLENITEEEPLEEGEITKEVPVDSDDIEHSRHAHGSADEDFKEPKTSING